MASGPIVREGRVVLAVELAMPKVDATPVLDSIANQQKQVAQATNQAASAATSSNAVTEALTAAVRQLTASLTSQAAAQASANAATSNATAANNANALSATARSDAADRVYAANLRVISSSFGVAKGFALIAAGQSDSLAKSLPYILVFEGLYTVSQKYAAQATAVIARMSAISAAEAVGAVATTGLAGAWGTLMAVMTPVNVLFAAVAAAAYTVYKAYDALTISADEAAEAERKHREEVEATVTALEGANERFKIRLDTDLEVIANLDTLEEKEKALKAAIDDRAQADVRAALAKIQASNAAAKSETELIDRVRKLVGKEPSGRSTYGSDPAVQEQQLQAMATKLDHELAKEKNLLKVKDEQKQKDEKAIAHREQLVKLTEREYESARKTLESEQNKERSLRAQVGALDASEQRKLQTLIKAADAGTLNRKQAIELGRLGGDPGKRLAEQTLAPFGKAIVDSLRAAVEKRTGERDPLAKAQDDFQRSNTAFKAAADGKTAATKLQELEDAKQQIVDNFQELSEEINATIRSLSVDLRDVRMEQIRAANGARQQGK